MGNAINAVGNLLNKENNQSLVADQDNVHNYEHEEAPQEEYMITDEDIQKNPLLGMPSDVLQIIFDEIDPDLAALARLFLVSKSFLLLFKFVHIKLDLRHRATKFYDSDLEHLFDYLSFVSSLRHTHKTPVRSQLHATITHVSIERIFKKWTNLQRLEMRGNSFTPAVIENLKNLTNLVSLDLQCTLLNGTSLKSSPSSPITAISRCTELRVLNMKGTQFILTEEIRSLVNLREFKFSGYLDEARPFEAFRALLDLTNLKKLHIDDPGLRLVVKVDPEEEEENSQVKNVDEHPYKSLGLMTQLTDLTLPGTKIPRKLLSALTSLTNLRTLKVDSYQHDTNDLRVLLKHVTGLKHFHLRYAKITDEDVVYLTRLRNLETLDLSGCSQITTVDEIELPRGLKYLSLSDSKINDVSMNHIANHLMNLEDLNLRNCHGITDEGVQKLANLTNLTRLCVRAVNDHLSPYSAYTFFPWKIRLY